MRRFTCLVETFLVATRDVLSFALVYPDSFPAESTCVSFWLAQCELCGCCCSAQCDVLCESCPAHQVPVFPFPCCCVSSSCARDCVFLTRDMACTTAQENLMCPSHPAQKKTNKTPRQHGSRWCSAGSVLCGPALACAAETFTVTSDAAMWNGSTQSFSTTSCTWETPPPQTSPRSPPEESALHPDGRILEQACVSTAPGLERSRNFRTMAAMRQIDRRRHTGRRRGPGNVHQLVYDEWCSGMVGALARIKVDEKNCFRMIEWAAV